MDKATTAQRAQAHGSSGDKARRLIEIEAQLAGASNYIEWKEAALEHDRLSGKDAWKFASESKNIRVAKVNADLNKKIIEKYQIKGLPLFVLIENGKEIKRFAGAMTKNDLIRFCDSK